MISLLAYIIWYFLSLMVMKATFSKIPLLLNIIFL